MTDERTPAAGGKASDLVRTTLNVLLFSFYALRPLLTAVKLHIGLSDSNNRLTRARPTC